MEINKLRIKTNKGVSQKLAGAYLEFISIIEMIKARILNNALKSCILEFDFAKCDF
ncbi:MAG: hypothetical protein J7604_07790 [Sporocytophaga sp.]|uniref:hypothetical protein n=1 Tax=Sporocytophaga sp. TaxID=2231183 RepID=UPI001B2A4706|nr:hypothetical protein [Sporocytophaga sp.]MBO9700098.1 hypothetical protein [Sporocytophaga sp.]